MLRRKRGRRVGGGRGGEGVELKGKGEMERGRDGKKKRRSQEKY